MVNVIAPVPAPLWIADDKTLQEACRRWSEADFLAVDTEFVRTSTFYPKPGLIQVADDHGAALIDPLAVSDWSDFRALMVSSDVVKVFHSCAEDLEVCKRIFDEVPSPLFDTQIAMALTGFGSSVGFQRAVNELLELDIPKEATRTDWLQRPLTEVQMEYATADVHYLHYLYPMLVARLEEKDRLGWLYEECERLVDSAREPEGDYSLAYHRVKSGWKLRPQEQCVLQYLAEWREQQARLKDVPRNKVADDPTLWNIARFKARNRDQLVKAGMRPHIVRDAGKQVLALVQSGLEQDAENWPQQLQKPLSIDDGNVLKSMKKVVVRCAEALDIPAELLANKKTLEAMIRSEQDDLPPHLSGWRKEQIADALIEHLKEIRQ